LGGKQAMRARWQSVALAPVLLMAGGIAPAAAHPHVWITAVTTFVFEGRQLVGVRQHWARRVLRLVRDRGARSGR
jgi:ABC-type uncharacterized transport system substrate-binding protein